MLAEDIKLCFTHCKHAFMRRCRLIIQKKKIIFFRKTAKMVKKTRLFEKMKSVNIDVGKQRQYATVRIKLHTSTLLSRNMSVLSAFTWRYNPNYLFSEEFSYIYKKENDITSNFYIRMMLSSKFCLKLFWVAQ